MAQKTLSPVQFENLNSRLEQLMRVRDKRTLSARFKKLICAVILLGNPAVVFAACPTPSIAYEYYEGDWDSLPDFSSLTAMVAGSQDNFSLSAVTPSDSFGYRFTSTIIVPSDNTYTFYSGPYASTRIRVNGVLVLDNDKLNGTAEVVSTAELTAGEHSLEVLYFTNTISNSPSLFWSSDTLSKRELSSSSSDSCDEVALANDALLLSDNGGSLLFSDDTSALTTGSSTVVTGAKDTQVHLGLLVDPALLAGGSQLDLVGTNVGFRASNAGTTPILFNVPENATYVRITGMGASDNSAINTVEEDYQFTSITIDLAKGTYSGHTAYVVSQNEGNDNYAFSNVELGQSSNSAHVAGDTSDLANTITLSLTDSSLSLVETQNLIDQGYLVEFLTNSKSSSNYLGADSLVIEKGVLSDTLELPTNTSFSILSILQARASSTSSEDEDKGMGYITIDADTMLASGVIYAHVGSGNENVSSYAFSNYDLTSGLPVLSSDAFIVGDKHAQESALPNLTLSLSGNTLSISRTPGMADVYSALYSANSFQRLAVSSSARVLGNSAVSGEFSDNATFADTFDLIIPDNAQTGQASLVMYNPSGSTSSNENSGVASFSIDLNNQTTTGSFISMRQITPDFVSWSNVPFGTRLIDHPDTISNHITDSDFTDQISGVLQFDLIDNVNGSRILRAVVKPVTGIGETYTRYKVTIGGQWAEHLPVEVTASVIGGTLSHGTFDSESGLWTLNADDVADLVFTPTPDFTGSAGFLTLNYNDVSDVVVIDISNDADTNVAAKNSHTAVQGSPVNIADGFSAALIDHDGSEIVKPLLTITPTHTISDGVNSFTATIDNNVVDVSSWDTTALTYYSPGSGVFTIVIHVLTTDDDSTSVLTDATDSSGSFNITVLADTNSNGIPDVYDSDNDGDGIPDAAEGTGDSDADGIVDSLDVDSDNDGIPDATEGYGDTDRDGIPNYLDNDSDNNGISDTEEGGANIDTNNNGIPDYLDLEFLDTDGDGISDVQEGNADNDNDGIPNNRDLDADNDGIPDAQESTGDTDGDGILDSQDLDSDNDGIPDLVEATGIDADGDGRVDDFLDSNGDGMDDGLAVLPLPIIDTDNDGVPNNRDLDADNDGIPNTQESGLAGFDQNADGKIDSLVDNDGDGWLNNLPSATLDTDGDGIADHLDLDSNGDGVSDLIESGGADLNGDGLADGWNDVDADGILDSVDADQVENALDSDEDGIADFADADFLAGNDSDGDGIAESFDFDPFGNGFASMQTGELQPDAASPSENIVASVSTDDSNLPQPTTGSGSTNPFVLLFLLGFSSLLLSPESRRQLKLRK